MDCARIRREGLIESYLCHQLDESASDELETHILGCRDCSQLLENLQSLRGELEKRATTIRAATTKERSFLFWLPAAATAAVLLAAGLGLLHFWKARREPLAVTAPPSPRPDATLPEVQQKLEALPPRATESPAQTILKRPNQEDRARRSLSDDSLGAPSQIPEGGQTNVAASREQQNGESEPKPEDSNPREAPSTMPGSSAVVEGPGGAATTREASGDFGQIKLTSAQGAELLRIGAVEPPPYSFSGFGQHAKYPKGGGVSGFGKRNDNSDTGRVLFQKGMDVYVEGRYKDALDTLLQASRQDKKTDDINFYLGICEILTGRLQDAEASLRSVVASGNSLYLQSAHYYLGKTYVQRMKLDQAEAEFRAAASLPGRLTADANALDVRVAALQADLQSK